MKNTWINIKNHKPVSTGFYEVWDADDRISLVSHWNGKFFGMCSRGMASMRAKVQEAFDGKDEPTEYNLTKWRELPKTSDYL